MLTAEEETTLALAWRDDGNEAALHTLTVAYLKFAISEASKYTRYKIPFEDLIQEASVGLMYASKKFDPDRGFRYSTYARHWISMYLREHVIRSKSLVRAGKTQAQRKLFFNMSRARRKIEHKAQIEGVNISWAEMNAIIAHDMKLPLKDVELMAGYMNGDFSLNAPQGSQEEGNATTFEDLLEDDTPSGAQLYENTESQAQYAKLIVDALDTLNDRERKIIQERKLTEDPKTLEVLGVEFSISKERVRQVEEKALEKMKKFLEREGINEKLFA
jgi:RNA polymerase sigma-32 factor